MHAGDFQRRLLLLLLHRSRGDSKLPTTWANKGKLKKEGQQERLV
jgi:hypothetical protein